MTAALPIATAIASISAGAASIGNSMCVSLLLARLTTIYRTWPLSSAPAPTTLATSRTGAFAIAYVPSLGCANGNFRRKPAGIKGSYRVIDDLSSRSQHPGDYDRTHDQRENK